MTPAFECERNGPSRCIPSGVSPTTLDFRAPFDLSRQFLRANASSQSLGEVTVVGKYAPTPRVAR